MLKQFINSIWNVFESFGKARAASILARNGRYKEAQDLYRN